MSGQGRRLVNEQFNSPVNLYSRQAIQETLDRQAHVLANGAVGIDFNQLAKPANLQNSAVLRMLEEEEEEARQRGGQSSSKRVAWPPPSEDLQEFDYVEQSPVRAKTRGIGEHPSYQSSLASGPSPLPSPSPSPSGPGGADTFRQPIAAAKSWAPVTPPSQQPAVEFSRQQEQHRQDRRPLNAQVNDTAVVAEPPPSTITLRPEPPISQVPSPVYRAQPAATKAPASGTMRGDLKWPPPSVKAQTEAENRARLELAKGPVCKPRRVNKDYTGFFAQHALNNAYPGYRVPPGTQYFTPAYQH